MVDVSIIVPFLMHQRTISTTLIQLINQSLQILNIILINDGSQDDSLKIIKIFY